MAEIRLDGTTASYKAVFALDVVSAAIALSLVLLATPPTWLRIKERRLSMPSEKRATPLKTSLGTYLFLYPGLLFFFLAYTFQFVTDILKTTGNIDYARGLQLHGRYAFDDTRHQYSIAVLSFATAMASIFFAALINGGVWIYSNHMLNNATGRHAPGTMSKLYNTFIMLAIVGTGLAAWGRGMAARGQYDTWSTAAHQDEATRILYVVHRCVIVAASISVSIEAWRRYSVVRANCQKDISDRPHLARFTLVVVPLIWIRNAFIVFDIVLLYVNSASWSHSSKLASTFLLIIFGQYANLTLLGMILYGAWQTGKTVWSFADNA